MSFRQRDIEKLLSDKISKCLPNFRTKTSTGEGLAGKKSADFTRSRNVGPQRTQTKKADEDGGHLPVYKTTIGTIPNKAAPQPERNLKISIIGVDACHSRNVLTKGRTTQMHHNVGMGNYGSGQKRMHVGSFMRQSASIKK